MQIFSSTIPLFTIVATVLTALLTGCTSPQDKRAAFREKMGPPQPALIATQAFLANRIVVTAHLNSSLPPRPPAGRNDNEDEPGERHAGHPAGEGRWGGGEGRNMPHFGGMDGGPGGGPRRGGGAAAAFPRQALTITLKNTSASPITVRVQDVVSILGNFVPFPEKATLAAGESVALEAMRGSLANLDELELTIGLAAGTDRDRQTFVLRRE